MTRITPIKPLCQEMWSTLLINNVASYSAAWFALCSLSCIVGSFSGVVQAPRRISKLKFNKQSAKHREMNTNKQRKTHTCRCCRVHCGSIASYIPPFPLQMGSANIGARLYSPGSLSEDSSLGLTCENQQDGVEEDQSRYS